MTPSTAKFCQGCAVDREFWLYWAVDLRMGPSQPRSRTWAGPPCPDAPAAGGGLQVTFFFFWRVSATAAKGTNSDMGFYPQKGRQRPPFRSVRTNRTV